MTTGGIIKGQWEDGYARYHQQYLSLKNSADKTGGNFKPAIKVFKHLRSMYNLDIVSFHIECLLCALPDNLFLGSPADYITRILKYIANYGADVWYYSEITTPCGDRNLFTENEWGLVSWRYFHEFVNIWAKLANIANSAVNSNQAIEAWQAILGKDYFPKEIT